MQPITREIIDRRQPAIRWSAVFAGTVVAVGLWGVLQLLGMGAGLVAIDPDDGGSAKTAMIGTGAWSVIAPLLALFVGGFVAGKLATTLDRRVAGTHGVVVWGLSAIAGLASTIFLASLAAHGASNVGDDLARTPARLDADRTDHTDAAAALAPINNRLRLAGKPQISAEQLVRAVREGTDDGRLDREDFIDALDEHTALGKDDAELVADQLGPRAEDLVGRSVVTPAQHDAMSAAEATGKGLLALAISILLSLGTAILGAVLALRRFGRDRDDRTDAAPRDREGREVHTTAPYPTAPPPSAMEP